MNWNNTSSASFTLNTVTGTADDSNYITFAPPDPLIDWLPNSCLYTKYVPTWHLVRSYSK